MPRVDDQGTIVLGENRKPLLRRWRPYYKTKTAAVADIENIQNQHGLCGASLGGIITREQATEFEQAKAIAPEVPLPALAKFWRLHHPTETTESIAALVPQFLAAVEVRLGRTRHYDDLKNRLHEFAGAFGQRLPATVTRTEILTWLLGMGRAGRTVLNYKRAVRNFLGWLHVDRELIAANPAAGIKKRQLPKAVKQEIEFLSLDEIERYLRACERYDPELIAHEVIQLFAGVRADDEMEDFSGDYVLPATREVVIPAAVAKTERREVINTLEDNFWDWWQVYGRKGVIRPTNYRRRWRRVRYLATLDDQAKADEEARLSPRQLVLRKDVSQTLTAWKWNARRRTFCTYHIAKYQSADRTALILRHRGEPYTLHNSYRGMGVTEDQGAACFKILPQKVARPIKPIIRQSTRAKAET